jgi:hypothetical protein
MLVFLPQILTVRLISRGIVAAYALAAVALDRCTFFDRSKELTAC